MCILKKKNIPTVQFDTNLVNKKMTKDANDHSHYEKLSQHASEDLTRGEMEKDQSI